MLHRSRVLPVALLAAIFTCTFVRADDVPAAGKQVAATFTATVAEKEQSLGYLIYLPKDYDKKKDDKWPMILFLHGAGERGNDISKVKVHGPPKLVGQGKDLPFVVISPQCPTGQWWNVDLLAKLVDQAIKDHRIDADRVYCTGLSMGGFGTWGLCSKHPDKFAAAVPICGGGDPKTVAAMKKITTWVFHGDKDTAVKIERSKEMVDALKAAGGKVEFTIYEGVGHDSWSKSYAMDELYEWMLKQKRGK